MFGYSKFGNSHFSQPSDGRDESAEATIQPVRKHQVCVKNFPPNCTNKELKALFTQFQLKVVQVYINYEHNFAYVTFTNESDVAQAIELANGYIFVKLEQSYQIIVEFAREKSQKLAAAIFTSKPAATGGWSAFAGGKSAQSLHHTACSPKGNIPQKRDPTTFSAKIQADIMALHYVPYKSATGFTKNYISEHGGDKEQGQFTSEEVDAAIKEFKEQVRPYDIFGPTAHTFIGDGNEDQKAYIRVPLMFFTWNQHLMQLNLQMDSSFYEILTPVRPKWIGAP